MPDKQLREVIQCGDIMALQDMLSDDPAAVLSERFEEDSSPLHAACWCVSV